MTKLKLTGITVAIAAVIAWNSISTTVAYHAGRNATVGRELAELRENLVNAISRHQENLAKYDQLALDYATAATREQREIGKLEQAIHAHIAKTRGTCRIDTRSVQLINAAIAAANANDRPAANRANSNRRLPGHPGDIRR